MKSDFKAKRIGEDIYVSGTYQRKYFNINLNEQDAFKLYKELKKSLKPLKIFKTEKEVSNYEIHFTVEVNKPIKFYTDFATSNNIKITHISLDKGDNPEQVMYTVRIQSSYLEASSYMRNNLNYFSTKGFNVIRYKIEIDESSKDLFKIIEKFPLGYFESHIKVKLYKRYRKVLEMLTSDSIRLSRNSFKTQEDSEFEEQFVNLRVYSNSYNEFITQVTDLKQRIEDLHIQILDIEKEYVIYDSNLKLDSGWI